MGRPSRVRPPTTRSDDADPPEPARAPDAPGDRRDEAVPLDPPERAREEEPPGWRGTA
jgi:hypothetical protein